ncbi:MAG TPA: hypothetical protein VEL74_19730, partial [Thermoanaerobaculia bacterium]|nr:hypothetical protein [Thermoanaerobaculia bacterium]
MKYPAHSRLLGFTLTALLGVSLAAAAPPEPFGETTDVVAVEVPVQVVRDGQPVRGLTAADFEVHEGRKKQPIVGFDVIDLAATPGATSATSATSAAQAQPAAVPAAARRHFLLLFDLSFSEPKSIGKAREAARDLVKGKLQPADLVAVATYSSRGAQLVLGFSPDRRQVDRAIDAVGLPELIDRNPDPLKLVAGEVEDMLASGYKAVDNEKMLEEIEAAVRESERA